MVSRLKFEGLTEIDPYSGSSNEPQDLQVLRNEFCIMEGMAENNFLIRRPGNEGSR